MEIIIEKIVYPGKSLGSYQGKKIFTDEGLPGELINIQITKEKNNYLEAKTLNIIKPSNNRIKPLCSHFKICSGYQYIKYPLQLDIKQNQIKEMFKHHLNIILDGEIIKASPQILGYRNKAHLNIIWKNSTPRLAYNQPQSSDLYAEIDDCSLFSNNINKLLKAFLKIVSDKKMDFIKEIIVKESASTKQMLLGLYVTKLKNKENTYKTLSSLKDSFPLKGIICLIEENKSFKEITLFGENILEENIGGKIFSFGIQSFFQINTAMLQELVKNIKAEFLAIEKKRIIDFYCGVGTLGITLALDKTKLIAVELSHENIYFLRKNIAANNIKNFDIYEGASEKLINNVLSKPTDLLIVDPPRAGLDSNDSEGIAEKHNASFILNLSCNPATLIRDLKILLKQYKLKTLGLYDFFPQTPHIETLCILEKI